MEFKPTLTHKNQIQLLRSRGLFVSNEKQAIKFLETHQYYHLNIYFHKLMKSKNYFKDNLCFDDVKRVYLNDQVIRNVLILILEEIETSIKSRTAYHLAEKYGPGAFYNADIFKNQNHYSRLKTEISKKSKREPVVKHHLLKYSGKYPIWVIVELLSFGQISKMYKNLLETDKKEIAKQYNASNEAILSNWFEVLSIQRNICAHYGYLFKRLYNSKRPVLPKLFKSEYSENNTLFTIFLVIKRISDNDTWNAFLVEFKTRLPASKICDLSDYGFPRNWEEIL